MRINLNRMLEQIERAPHLGALLSEYAPINPLWAVTDWGLFGRTTADVRASAGTRNKMCHFPP